MANPIPSKISVARGGKLEPQVSLAAADATWLEFSEGNGAFSYAFGSLFHRGQTRSLHELGITPDLTQGDVIVRLVAGDDVVVASAQQGGPQARLGMGGTVVARLIPDGGRFTQTVSFSSPTADILVLTPTGEIVCSEPTCPGTNRVVIDVR